MTDKITDLRIADPVALVNFAEKAELLRDIEAHLRRRQGFTLATLNLDHIVKMRVSPAFRGAYAQHSHIVADGNPIVWLSRLADRRIELIPGSELITPLAALAARTNVTVALFGATQETLDLAAARLEARHPGLKVTAKIAPPFGFDPDSAEADNYLDQIAASGAQICFLALGAPKQEMLAIRGMQRVPHCGFVSIGAGLDFIAGSQTRAPVWVRKLAAEWVWRLMSNPRRLAKRYAQCIMVMPGLALTALRQRNHPA